MPAKAARRNKHFLEQVGVHSIVDVVGYLYIGQSTTKYYIPYLELNDPSNCQTFFLVCVSFIIGCVNLYYFLLFPRCDSLCFLKAAVVVDTKTQVTMYNHKKVIKTLKGPFIIVAIMILLTQETRYLKQEGALHQPCYLVNACFCLIKTL